ncbi:hypothetical protein E2C01_078570 [Portunus trituberculatus]|uniref:Uncharacterized protein n=1 Tax=Portunus trituberculatus TaxID=210409 RepID=A0A5B7IH94_PORTR|nr:hypothetical protein [Portunus trituberculatus]
MKEKWGTNEARQRMRQKIALWEQRGTDYPGEAPDSPREQPASLGKEQHLWVTSHPPRPPQPGEGRQVCMDLTSPAFTPTSPSSSSCGSSLHENGTSESDEALLRESSAPTVTTPVRNAAVKRFWQQQVWEQCSLPGASLASWPLRLG